MAIPKVERDEMKRKLLMYDLMSAAEKELAGLPKNAVVWAEKQGISRNTVTNWRKEPEYRAQLEEMREKRSQQARLEAMENGEAVYVTRPRESDAVDESVTNADLMARILRNQLVRAAEGGPNAKDALEWVRSPSVSKPLLDALTAQVETVFPEKSTEDLIDMILDAAGPQVVERAKLRGLL